MEVTQKGCVYCWRSLSKIMFPCCALPQINSTCMLHLNTDAMILWQMVMSVAKDTTGAKAFSI